MPVQSEMVHSAGLSFAMQRKLVMLRDVKKLPWRDIAKSIVNLQGEQPCVQTLINYHQKFSVSLGHAKSKYANCGRKAWKLTPAVKTWLVKRMLALRKSCVCTSTTLQHALARERGVKLSRRAIRKELQGMGYKWLPRSQKRQYSASEKRGRMDFARKLLRLSTRQLKKKVAMSMDGVILTMPPADETDRFNYCRYGEEFMWRKPCESTSPSLAGDDPYGKQAPLSRCLPMWAGIGWGGAGVVTFHKQKKLSTEEWLKCLRAGSLRKAIVDTGPISKRSPWTVLSDNEAFLRCRAARALYKRVGVTMWHIPARSPDLNPVERFWAFLRKHLRAMDLKDAIAKRPVLGKTAYRERVRRVMKSKKAKDIAMKNMTSLRKTCREVLKLKGAATKY